ncbi:sporulation integral membrane protein YtvI [Fictibacillus iocasae]|uniref:Sporulation integral membrane protein YtvI n=1 Tax=Fictibacillus iocasae TaxID=2715437 RepID=A0ABW2NLP2_9BACL
MTLKNLILIVLLLAGIFIFVFYSIPLLLALVTAIMLENVVQVLMKRFKMKRLLSVSVVFILFLAGFGILSWWLTTNLVVQIIEFSQIIPSYSVHIFNIAENTFYEWENFYSTLPPEIVRTIESGLDGLQNYGVNSATKLTNAIIGVVTYIPELLIYIVIYLVAVFLFSLDLPRLYAEFLNLFTTSAREKVEIVFSQLSKATVGFFRAQIILSFITYVLAFIGLVILDVKYAVILSLLIVIVDILPILGTGSFLVPWALYNFFVSNNDHLAIGLLILFGVITVIRRIIEPKILGSSLGISALAALASLYIGFQLLGFIGLIVGPACVIVYEALRSAGFLKIKIDF